MTIDQLKDKIVDVPDFPQKGIIFKDITPILAEPAAFDALMHLLADSVDGKVDKVAAIESRGFLLGAPLARQLNAGLVLVRKKGKLPRKTVSCSYGLEYGQDTLEIQEGDICAGDKVLIVDDVLATGGTAAATEKLCRQLNGDVVGFRFLIGLKALNGAEKLQAPSHNMIEF